MQWRWLLTILYGLCVIWVGLLRSIEAGAFKPNAFWFCLATGLMSIAAGYLLRVDRSCLGSLLALMAVLPVLSFYVYCFVTQPEKDATYRVGLAIIASVGQLCVITVPRSNK